MDQFGPMHDKGAMRLKQMCLKHLSDDYSKLVIDLFLLRKRRLVLFENNTISLLLASVLKVFRLSPSRSVALEFRAVKGYSCRTTH